MEEVNSNQDMFNFVWGHLLFPLVSAAHAPYKWDYWPHEDVRAECRFVGLTNLGATCYLASTIQQLYMIPEARQAVFTAKVEFQIVNQICIPKN